MRPRAHALQQEKPLQQAHTKHLESSLHSPQLEKDYTQQDPVQPKANKYNKISLQDSNYLLRKRFQGNYYSIIIFIQDGKKSKYKKFARPRGIGWRGRWEGGSGWGIHVNPWLIHVNAWQKPLQYCKVISLQLIKINGKKKKFAFLKTRYVCTSIFFK